MFSLLFLIIFLENEIFTTIPAWYFDAFTLFSLYHEGLPIRSPFFVFFIPSAKPPVRIGLYMRLIKQLLAKTEIYVKMASTKVRMPIL